MAESDEKNIESSVMMALTIIVCVWNLYFLADSMKSEKFLSLAALDILFDRSTCQLRLFLSCH